MFDTYQYYIAGITNQVSSMNKKLRCLNGRPFDDCAITKIYEVFIGCSRDTWITILTTNLSISETRSNHQNNKTTSL